MAAIILLKPYTGLADSNVVVGGNSVQASVKFRIVIPQNLYMSIGAAEEEEISTRSGDQSKVVVSDLSAHDKRLSVKVPGTLPKIRSVDISDTLPSKDENIQLINGSGQYVLCSP